MLVVKLTVIVYHYCNNTNKLFCLRYCCENLFKKFGEFKFDQKYFAK